MNLFNVLPIATIRFTQLGFTLVAVACTSPRGSSTVRSVERTDTAPAPNAPAPSAPAPSAPAASASARGAAIANAARAEPHNAAECAACNGIWGKQGMAGIEQCNCRTGDSGKRCSDGAECEGLCIAAEQPEREVVQAGPPARGYFVGRCSETKRVFGCQRFIARGAKAAAPSDLSEPPPKICID